MNISSVLWQKNPALAWREVDDDTIIISPNESLMHELNDTGSFLWKNIDGQKSAAQLADLLVAAYEVSPEIALADTESLLQELSSRKLVVEVASSDKGSK
jgi:Coenzyme PQQ synthesis protein D (PqqD)